MCTSQPERLLLSLGPPIPARPLPFHPDVQSLAGGDPSWASAPSGPAPGSGPSGPAPTPGLPPPSQGLRAAWAHPNTRPHLWSPPLVLSATSPMHAAPPPSPETPLSLHVPTHSFPRCAALTDGVSPRCRAWVSATTASSQPCIRGSVIFLLSWRACPCYHSQRPPRSWSLLRLPSCGLLALLLGTASLSSGSRGALSVTPRVVPSLHPTGSGATLPT